MMKTWRGVRPVRGEAKCALGTNRDYCADKETYVLHFPLVRNESSI